MLFNARAATPEYFSVTWLPGVPHQFSRTISQKYILMAPCQPIKWQKQLHSAWLNLLCGWMVSTRGAERVSIAGLLNSRWWKGDGMYKSSPRRDQVHWHCWSQPSMKWDDRTRRDDPVIPHKYEAIIKTSSFCHDGTLNRETSSHLIPNPTASPKCEASDRNGFCKPNLKSPLGYLHVRVWLKTMCKKRRDHCLCRPIKIYVSALIDVWQAIHYREYMTRKISLQMQKARCRIKNCPWMPAPIWRQQISIPLEENTPNFN